MLKNAYIKRVIVAFLYILTNLNLYSQALPDSSYIALKVSRQLNAISLRWSVNNSDLWQQTNETGFRLEKYIVRRDGKLLPNPEKQILCSNLKALPIEQWEKESLKNPKAAIVAQALYGDSFSLEAMKENQKPDLKTLINITQELEQRFLVSMYAAELDYKVACMAAWGFTDSAIKDNEDYLYRVYAADSLLQNKVNYGYAYAQKKTKSLLPKPLSFSGKFLDHMVILSWDISYLRYEYTAYNVERSEDGHNFSKLFDTPITNISGKNLITIPDSLPSNHKTYYYRIYGINLFGEHGDYSDTIKGEGYKPLSVNPIITKSYVDDSGKLNLSWKFDSTAQDPIAHFELRRAASDKSTFETVVDNIDPKLRQLQFGNLMPTNYFVIAAVPQTGSPALSYSVLVQPIDSVPPAKPQGLKGTIDSLGVVVLTWDPNTDLDIYGYRIFRSFTNGGKLFMLNDIAIKQTTCKDTIQLKDLNRKIYYSVAALDMRYNQSSLSDTLELTKPDIIPPTAPVIKKFKSSKDGVQLYWICSSSEDATNTNIYRYTANSSDSAILIKSVELPIDSFIDSDTQYSEMYKYELKTRDDSGLLSDASPSIYVRAVTQKPGKVKLSVDHIGQTNLLTWKLPQNSSFRNIEVYKKTDDGNFSLWKTLPGFDTSVADNNIPIGLECSYFIKLYPTKGHPIFSDQIK